MDAVEHVGEELLGVLLLVAQELLRVTTHRRLEVTRRHLSSSGRVVEMLHSFSDVQCTGTYKRIKVRRLHARQGQIQREKGEGKGLTAPCLPDHICLMSAPKARASSPPVPSLLVSLMHDSY